MKKSKKNVIPKWKIAQTAIFLCKTIFRFSEIYIRVQDLIRVLCACHCCTCVCLNALILPSVLLKFSVKFSVYRATEKCVLENNFCVELLEVFLVGVWIWYAFIPFATASLLYIERSSRFPIPNTVDDRQQQQQQHHHKI